MIESTLQRLERVKKQYFVLNGQKQSLENRQLEINKELEDLKNKELMLKEAVKIISELLVVLKTKVFKIIETLITKGVQLIWNKSYQVELQIKALKNKNVAEILIKRDLEDNKKLSIDPWSAGGGLRDFLSILFKIFGNIYLSKNRMVILDEPFKFLSKDKSVKLIIFLSQLCKKFNIQIILISHDPNVLNAKVRQLCDRVYEIKQTDGVSEAVLVN